MRLFVYEYLAGGRWQAKGHSCDELPSLAAEGWAMLAALAADFAEIEGAEVTCLRDARQTARPPDGCRCIDVPSAAEHDAAFDRAAAAADWTVIVAPEIDGILSDLHRRALTAGGRLLGHAPQLIELASDKQAAAEHLARAGVPTPRGGPHQLGQPWPQDIRYPAIWKPRDGAGSLGLRWVEHGAAAPSPTEPRPGRLETFHHGMAASVAFLCGPNEKIALPPCAQRLSLDGQFRYLGGSLPLRPRLAKRASCLAGGAVESLPQPLGYLGVDLILGEQEDGGGDVVLEINPRLTSSYLGLRAACRENLAAAMLAIALGQRHRLSFGDEPISFSADGQVSAA